MDGFTTARMVASPLTLADAALFGRLWGDERVARTLGGIRDQQQVFEAVVAGVEHWKRHGFGRWVLRAREQAVGTVKLATWNGLGYPEVELGYALFPESWGRGYATEAAAGALQYAGAVVGLSEVVAFALAENRASLAVMQRLGFEREQPFVLAGRKHVLRRRHVGVVPL